MQGKETTLQVQVLETWGMPESTMMTPCPSLIQNVALTWTSGCRVLGKMGVGQAALSAKACFDTWEPAPQA